MYLPESREFPSSATPYMSGGWTAALPRLSGTSPVIRRIMLAVSLSLGGQAAGRERDREEGLRYYTSSLEEMAGALRDGKKVDHTTLVVTARLFSMYEVGLISSPRSRYPESWRAWLTWPWGRSISGTIPAIS